MTAQVNDILIYKDETLPIASKPLKSYLEKATLPHNLVPPSSACWRGYVAQWAIDNKKLFLINWHGYILDYQEVGIDYLFPGEEFVFADWFSGEIRIGIGGMVLYIHGGYESVHRGNRFLIFEKGILVDEYEKWLTQEEIDKVLEVDDTLPF